MTLRESSIEIAASRARVWEVLATLDALEYRLKFGPLGLLMHAAIVRVAGEPASSSSGIEQFLRGLKRLAETKAGNVAP